MNSMQMRQSLRGSWTAESNPFAQLLFLLSCLAISGVAWCDDASHPTHPGIAIFSAEACSGGKTVSPAPGRKILRFAGFSAEALVPPAKEGGGKSEETLAPGDIPQPSSDRGGQQPDVDSSNLRRQLATAAISEEENPFVDLIYQMQLAGRLLREHTKPERTLQVQAEIIARLEELLKQRNNPSAQAPPASGSQMAQPETSQNLPTQTEAASEETASTTNPTGQIGAGEGRRQSEVSTQDLSAFLKKLWGELPERARAQVTETFTEEFLPKYRRLIQQYYRRLAEERQP